MSEIEQFRSRARKWLAEAGIPGVPLDLEERFAVLRDWQRTLFDAGWMGLSWPCEAGGQGLSPRHQFVFAEELARAHAPAPIGLIGLDVVGPSINAFGTPEQRARFLPPLLSGEEIWCQGFSEPGSGSDLASLRTRAVRDGEDYVVDGQKVWTSWGAYADWCALLCRTDPAAAPKHAGISYLLVDMTSPGITVRPIVQMTGDPEFCEVFFDGVRVPAANLLGEENGGWRIALDTLSRERGNYTMRRRVEIEWMLADAVAQLRAIPESRRADPRVAEEIGKADLALRVLEAQTRRTLDRLTADTGADPLDSIDKLVLNDTEQAVCAAIAELLGPFRVAPGTSPLGLDAGRWVHDHYYSRAASIYGGTAQIQRNIVAERLLGLPRG
ncbi:acyl-CoA dehydrogenase family protein [Pseudonocardia acidicola]|uniref:Acyl-CoA dehydrogenase n=1 Tax=Pseudonocardia acidicola TaxID=2724939 RepID=A0ABX1S4C3_9PSEU|nr:acyl-CoA dehydrogenase family protein [Pseudonocardia acidicola]NMH95940.1 acyl-CoA dehydrogenase [Pseudonocardia acidicola]